MTHAATLLRALSRAQPTPQGTVRTSDSLPWMSRAQMQLTQRQLQTCGCRVWTHLNPTSLCWSIVVERPHVQ